jgi:hypothetical protein
LSQATGHSGGYEKRDINVKNISWFTLISIVVLAVLLVMVDEWFIKTKEDLYYEMVLKPKNPELLQVRAREERLLNSYGIADSTGAFRIPIDSAMALVAVEEESGKKK